LNFVLLPINCGKIQTTKYKVPRSSSFNDPQQMRNLGYRAAHGSIIRTLDNLVELRQTQAANHLFMSFRRGYETSVLLNPDLAGIRLLAFLCSLFRHKYLVKVKGEK